MHGELSILNDTTFWYSVAVVVFIVAAIWKGRAPIGAILDTEIAKIQKELDEAKRLRAEAAQTLETYKTKQKDAIKEAELIVTKAKEDAERIRIEAEQSLRVDLDRHEQLVIERIKIAQEDAVKDVRDFIVQTALHDVHRMIDKIKGASDKNKLIDGIIADIPKLKHVKKA
ncbi:MAG: hypothetical protein EOM37_01675 [Proteobacteria bacterium]|jgi:F-type H+-transporting ATPase subunit b|nr:hypothetical protein [Alphaproteobacteria bacterium]NCC02747.1 hypothetical protein [Pseudomonadota bacterium]